MADESFSSPDGCPLQTREGMLFQNPYLALTHRYVRVLGPVWIATCAMVLGSVGCAHKPKTRLTEVEVAKPVRAEVPVYSEWIGTTIGYIDAQIHSKVTGYLLTQEYKEGSLVRAGDPLFEVDPRPFQAVVDQANAQLSVASAELTQARADVDAARAEIDRAEAAQAKTQLDVKRYTPLVRDGTVSQQEFDDAVQSNLANQASVAAAKGKYDHALATVKAAEAQLDVARSSLQGAQLEPGFHKSQVSYQRDSRHSCRQHRRPRRDGSKGSSDDGFANRSHLRPVSDQRPRVFRLAQVFPR
jgi:multidrug efflux pump subunit AcrA (membrane-fusion protein)